MPSTFDSGLRARLIMVLSLSLLLGAASARSAPLPPNASAMAVDCTQIERYRLEMQTNGRATAVLAACGRAPNFMAGPAATPSVLVPPWANALAAADTPVNNALADTYPKVTQAEATIATNGMTVVVTFDSSTNAPTNFSGVSYSSDGGATFTESRPSPLTSGHGTNYGDTRVVFNQRLNRWLAVSLASGCGGQGLGIWSSADGVTWTTGACAHDSPSDDAPSLWTDNTPASPYYGRLYLAWNDFNAAGGGIFANFSDDAVQWSTPAPVYTGTSFRRSVQITGSPNGKVYLAAMDEGQNGGNSNRTNYLYRSSVGGASWSELAMGASFAPAGDMLCGTYFSAITPLWRFMGAGRMAVGPDEAIHYVYGGRGTLADDPGDIFYTRSNDLGNTWSTPLRLNQVGDETGTRAQWIPSLAVSPNNVLFASWYDRRNTADNSYQIVGRRSLDGGLSWESDFAVSDQVIPQPIQPDGNLAACYGGDLNNSTATGTTAYVAWTDGRVTRNGNSQMDIYLDRVALPGPPNLLVDGFEGP